MSNWNYRIMRHCQEKGADTFALHEVYYDDDGKPKSWMQEPEMGQWDSVDELIRAHEMMLADAQKWRDAVLDFGADPAAQSRDC